MQAGFILDIFSAIQATEVSQDRVDSYGTQALGQLCPTIKCHPIHGV